jgi:uncharacterized protein with NAD-binding domain and iron-sulfur cluster
MATSVAVLGGGVAGLSAAHELAERGFTVTVHEKRAVPGGKARSYPAPDSGLPAEHGFRFFPGFYRHLPDTMARIPAGAGTAIAWSAPSASCSPRPAEATSWSRPRTCRSRSATSRRWRGSRSRRRPRSASPRPTSRSWSTGCSRC